MAFFATAELDIGLSSTHTILESRIQGGTLAPLGRRKLLGPTVSYLGFPFPFLKIPYLPVKTQTRPHLPLKHTPSQSQPPHIILFSEPLLHIQYV